MVVRFEGLLAVVAVRTSIAVITTVTTVDIIIVNALIKSGFLFRVSKGVS
jgi:hypothetical protein